MTTNTVRQEVNVRLLGSFAIHVRGMPERRLESRRARELLAYLVINRQRMITREVIAETLWPTSQGEARKNLRHVLWLLHSKLDGAVGAPLIVADGTSIGIDPRAPLSADVGELEVAHSRLHMERSLELSGELAALVKDVVSGCSGELLEGCYEDWCLLERERYRAIHLNAIDRLITHAETVGDVDSGIEYGEVLLRHDRASERTHRRLMALRYQAGDRTGAVRQFLTCEQALRDELDVGPGPATLAMYEVVRSSQAIADEVVTLDTDRRDLPNAVELLGELSTLIHQASRLIQQVTTVVEERQIEPRHVEDA